MDNSSTIPYRKALDDTERAGKLPPLFGFMFAKKKNRIAEALQALRDAAVEEYNVIQKEMQNAVVDASAARDNKVEDIRARKEMEEEQSAEAAANALAAYDKEVNDARSKKDRQDRQDAEVAANILAAYDKKMKDARSRRDRAIAYIKQQYQAFDIRLCQCLDKFQMVVDTWATENADATSLLDENRIQNFSENGKRIGSRLTRVGTVSIWDLSGKTSWAGQDKMEPAKSDTAIQPVKRPTVSQDDVEAVKYHLMAIANANEQEHTEALENLNKLAQHGRVEAQFILGGMYENGTDVQRNKNEAATWYQKAAEQGHAEALENLNKLAQHGRAKAQFILGDMFYFGRSVSKDEVEAAQMVSKGS